jgi:hypothetical protein
MMTLILVCLLLGSLTATHAFTSGPAGGAPFDYQQNYRQNYQTEVYTSPYPSSRSPPPPPQQQFGTFDPNLYCGCSQIPDKWLYNSCTTRNWKENVRFYTTLYSAIGYIQFYYGDPCYAYTAAKALDEAFYEVLNVPLDDRENGEINDKQRMAALCCGGCAAWNAVLRRFFEIVCWPSWAEELLFAKGDGFYWIFTASCMDGPYPIEFTFPNGPGTSNVAPYSTPGLGQNQGYSPDPTYQNNLPSLAESQRQSYGPQQYQSSNSRSGYRTSTSSNINQNQFPNQYQNPVPNQFQEPNQYQNQFGSQYQKKYATGSSQSVPNNNNVWSANSPIQAPAVNQYQNQFQSQYQSPNPYQNQYVGQKQSAASQYQQQGQFGQYQNQFGQYQNQYQQSGASANGYQNQGQRGRIQIRQQSPFGVKQLNSRTKQSDDTEDNEEDIEQAEGEQVGQLYRPKRKKMATSSSNPKSHHASKSNSKAKPPGSSKQSVRTKSSRSSKSSKSTGRSTGRSGSRTGSKLTNFTRQSFGYQGNENMNRFYPFL